MKTTSKPIDLSNHPVASREECTAARIELLKKEKELTRQRDRVAAERRALPFVRVEKEYEFTGPKGKVTLADLFQGRSQLIVQHFMFGPDWKEGCVGCSFEADHVDAARQHFEHRDVSFAAISRAPIKKIESFKRRMGWKFAWVSSFGSDFNYDFGVSATPKQMASGKFYYNYRMDDAEIEELPGVSVFYQDKEGSVFHTYSMFARGAEILDTAYMYLDLVPKGRDEDHLEEKPSWWRHHDRYDDDGAKRPESEASRTKTEEPACACAES